MAATRTTLLYGLLVGIPIVRNIWVDGLCEGLLGIVPSRFQQLIPLIAIDTDAVLFLQPETGVGIKNIAFLEDGKTWTWGTHARP